MNPWVAIRPACQCLTKALISILRKTRRGTRPPEFHDMQNVFMFMCNKILDAVQNGRKAWNILNMCVFVGNISKETF